MTEPRDRSALPRARPAGDRAAAVPRRRLLVRPAGDAAVHRRGDHRLRLLAVHRRRPGPDRAVAAADRRRRLRRRPRSSSSRSSLAFAGPVSREVALLIRSGPDALETALRQVLGGDSVTIGDRTLTVEELADPGPGGDQRVPPDAGGRDPRRRAAPPRRARRRPDDDRDLLPAARRRAVREDGAAVPRPCRPGPDAAGRGRIHVVVGQWLRGQLVLVVFVS